MSYIQRHKQHKPARHVLSVSHVCFSELPLSEDNPTTKSYQKRCGLTLPTLPPHHVWKQCFVSFLVTAAKNVCSIHGYKIKLFNLRVGICAIFWILTNGEEQYSDAPKHDTLPHVTNLV